MDPEYFVWYERNHKFLTEDYDKLYVEQPDSLESYRRWEEFVHGKYLKYKETINETITI